MFPRGFLKIASAILALVCVCAGCKSSAPDKNHSAIQHSDEHYAYLFGQKYRAKTDLYLFLFTHQPDYLYIGGHGFGPRELPAEVTKTNVGQSFGLMTEPGDLGDLKILNVVPAGSILTIHAETHEVTPLSGIRGSGGYPMGFICLLNYDGKTNYIFSEFIQSHRKVAGKVPNEYINEAVAEKIR